MGPFAKIRLAGRVWTSFVRVHWSLRRAELPQAAAQVGAAARAWWHPLAPMRLSRTVHRVLRVGPWRPRCLIGSMVLYRLLRAQGTDAELVIGLPDHAEDRRSPRVGRGQRRRRRTAAGPGRPPRTGPVPVVRTRQELGEALTAILRDPPPPGLRPQLEWFLPDDLPQLALHASRHRVAPFVSRALRTARLTPSPEASAELDRTHAHWAAVHLLALEDLRTLGDVLGGADVRFLVIKGPVLAEHHYPSPDLRAYDDLDVLIAPGDFESAIAALEGAGLDLVDRNWELIRGEGRAQLHLQLPLGTLADVHWSLLNRGTVRDAFDVPTDALMANARELEIAGMSVRTLDAEDTLLHLCVHATLSGGDRLIWSKDVERAIVVDAPAWDEVIRRARSWRAGPSVAIALDRARGQLGTPVPDAVLRDLYGSSVRRAITTGVDRWRPPERSIGEMSAAVLWSQVCRAGWGDTFHALRGRATRRSRNVLQGADPDDAPIYRPTGDAADETGYLHDVSEPEGRGERDV